ncbi:ArsR family transcriptional regulator [Tenggerimyces flavus]|uniref:ArsR/SmtB family transcription factor n=1 Tax=Tenggerimyces flavus TaxID=1708749 RepID=A0ABV7YN16_9ACTN|nr:helix-turn-helix domain-containing protein [Tenggerimyces flavus]MBM7787373.1 hypothetical protein [Tenggerimyces flavus]
MTDSIPPFAPASVAPEFVAAPASLAAVVPTTMLFVDYALGGLTTPTFEFQQLAQELPRDLVEASHPLRAALAHGSHLRAVLLGQLPADHPGHRDWPALRAWLDERADDWMLGLVESGVNQVLVLDTADPPRVLDSEVAGLLGTLDELRRDATTVLGIWGVPDPAARVDEVLASEPIRSTLLALLDEIWERWLGLAWTEQLPAMDAAVAAAPPPYTAATGTQWIKAVSGLLPDPVYAAAADRAPRLTLVPCPGLERSLTMFGVDGGETAYVLFSPQSGPRKRAGLPVGARLTPVLQALGDQTRLAIVLQLLDQGPMTMQELTDVLRVHQTTISRQVGALRKAQLVSQDGNRRVVVQPDAIRDACQTLLDAL